jgi:L-fucose isomerase-like protein
MYLALKKMSEEGNWSGLSVKCQHEFSTYLRCTACLPLSILTDEGTMCTDEGDIHALLTMVVMRWLSDGEPIYFGDIYKLEEGGFLMDHCGLSPHSCAGDGEKVALLPQTPRISKDGKTTGGVVSSYSFREGDVTIGRIEQDRSGAYTFHFSRGRVKPIESIAYGWSSLVFTPEGSDGEFAERQLANHYIFVYRDIADRIEAYCSINGIKPVC